MPRARASTRRKGPKSRIRLKERQKKYMQGFVQAGLATLVLALPSKKMLAKRGDIHGRLETSELEFRHFDSGRLDAWQPGARLVEAGDVYAELIGVESPDEFRHLPLGSTRFEAGDHDRDRDRQLNG